MVLEDCKSSKSREAAIFYRNISSSVADAGKG